MATLEEILRRKFRTRNKLLRIVLAEIFSTFTLVIYINGSAAQAIYSLNTAGVFPTACAAAGLGVTMGLYVAGGSSGAQMNPSVTLAYACIGQTPWFQVPFYIFSQYFGAFCAAACVHLMYKDALNNFYPSGKDVPGSAGAFGTYPQDFLSIKNGFFDQFFGTAILLLVIMAIADNKNNGPQGPQKGLLPIAIGLLVMVLALGLGFNCGVPVNPARDLGPRLYTLVAGWGTETFTYRNWSWVPVVAAHLGAITGSYMYLLFVGFHHPESE